MEHFVSIKKLPSCTLGALFLVLSTGFASSSTLIANGDFSAGDTGFTTGYGQTTATPLFQSGNLHYDVNDFNDLEGVTGGRPGNSQVSRR